MKFLPEAKDNSGMSEALGKLYHNKSGQCLERIKTNQTTLQTLQAMIAHGIFGFSHHEEWGAGLITHIGSIVRLAMRLGLHRDPSHFSNLSPFEGEMRRRIWSTIDQIDCLSSFHLGIPTAVRSEDSDTDPPRNLLDTDMEEGMSELPPSRPFSTSVPIGYLLAKFKLSRVMRRVVEFLNSVQRQPYERVLQLDSDLMEAHRSIPPHLQLNNWHNAPNEPAYVMVQKVQLDTLYHQAVTALHRKYLQEARKDPKFALSQQRSIDSSMTLLRHQATIYREAQPGGCFSDFHGYTITPDSANFSLAAMVLCLYLQYWTRTDQGVPSHTEARVQEIFQALDTSRQIWKTTWLVRIVKQARLDSCLTQSWSCYGRSLAFQIDLHRLLTWRSQWMAKGVFLKTPPRVISLRLFPMHILIHTQMVQRTPTWIWLTLIGCVAF
jgi:hypothetical protein